MALRFWIAEKAPPIVPGGIRTDSGGIFNFLDQTTESAAPAPTGTHFYIFYWAQTSPTHWSVLACWDHAFDGVVYATTESEWAKPVAERVARAWPIYTRLAANGAEGKLADGAIVSVKSVEDQSAVAIEFPSPEFATIGDYFEGASGEAVDRLFRINADLLRETKEGVAAIPDLVTAFYGDDRTTRRLKAFQSAFGHLQDFYDLIK